MKNALAAAAALMIICSSGSVFAALPPGVFTSQRPPAHIASSHRVHVNPSHRMHTPTGNRVRMTPTHGQNGPVGGRMASIHHGRHHVAVERFAAPRVELHAELRVHAVELVDGDLDELLPQLHVVGIALLELHQFLASTFIKLCIHLMIIPD